MFQNPFDYLCNPYAKNENLSRLAVKKGLRGGKFRNNEQGTRNDEASGMKN